MAMKVFEEEVCGTRQLKWGLNIFITTLMPSREHSLWEGTNQPTKYNDFCCSQPVSLSPQLPQCWHNKLLNRVAMVAEMEAIYESNSIGVLVTAVWKSNLLCTETKDQHSSGPMPPFLKDINQPFPTEKESITCLSQELNSALQIILKILTP